MAKKKTSNPGKKAMIEESKFLESKGKKQKVGTSTDQAPMLPKKMAKGMEAMDLPGKMKGKMEKKGFPAKKKTSKTK